MSKKKVRIFIFLAISLLLLLLLSIPQKVVNWNNSKTIETLGDYAFEKTKDSVITKKFDGNYLYPLVTIALDNKEIDIRLEDLDEGSNVYLINPETGEEIPLEDNQGGKYSVKTSLEKDIDYGVIMNFKLIGSIRVVDDLDIPNQNKVFTDILTTLGCGL